MPSPGQKYSTPKAYRLLREFIAILDMAGEKWGVAPREIIQLAVSDYVRALENGGIELPVEGETRKFNLKLPKIARI